MGLSVKENARRRSVARCSTTVSTQGVNRLLNNLFPERLFSSVV